MSMIYPGVIIIHFGIKILHTAPLKNLLEMYVQALSLSLYDIHVNSDLRQATFLSVLETYAKV